MFQSILQRANLFGSKGGNDHSEGCLGDVPVGPSRSYSRTQTVVTSSADGGWWAVDAGCWMLDARRLTLESGHFPLWGVELDIAIGYGAASFDSAGVVH